MAYDMSFAENVTGWPGFVEGFNTALGGVPAVFFVFLIYVGLFAAFKTSNTTTHAFIASSFIASIVAGLFLFWGLIPFYVVLIPIIVLVANLVYEFFG